MKPWSDKSKTIQQEFSQELTAGPKRQTHYSPTNTKQRGKTQKPESVAPKYHFNGLHLKKTFYKWCTKSFELSCVYLTERRSRLLALFILTWMNPTWCHHSTWLKILFSISSHIEKVAPAGCKKICSLYPIYTSILPWFLSPSVEGAETCVIITFCFDELQADFKMKYSHMASHTVQGPVKQHESIPLLLNAHNSRPSALNCGHSTLCNRS